MSGKCPCGKCHCFICGNQMERDLEIQSLQSQVARLKADLKEVCEFYGNKDSWKRSNKSAHSIITYNDMEEGMSFERGGYKYYNVALGGKLARQKLKGIEE